MHSYQTIDMKTWKRAQHCKNFRDYLEPEYRITVLLDVGHFSDVVKANGWSFTLAMNYAAVKCASEFEEFRYRFLDGEVVLFDEVDTRFTYLNKETELFREITAPLTDSMAHYVATAEKIAAQQDSYFTAKEPVDVIWCSSMPWFTYTHCSHADPGGERDGAPHLEWGRYELQEGRKRMPFTVHVHHSFADAVHVGKLVNRLQEYLDSLPDR